MEKTSEVLSGLVVGHKNDGRCRYGPLVKQELIRQCMKPGLSVALISKPIEVRRRRLPPKSVALAPPQAQINYDRFHVITIRALTSAYLTSGVMA